jgi:hypothetical protein
MVEKRSGIGAHLPDGAAPAAFFDELVVMPILSEC